MERPAIFFDLDNTLFDHNHSLTCAMTAVQKMYPFFDGFSVPLLVDFYNRALSETHDQYVSGQITQEDSNIEKVALFFTMFGLQRPSAEQIHIFRETHEYVYRVNRQAAPGAIETLIELKNRGYLTAIVTNGSMYEERKKAEVIGVGFHVHKMITSEEAGFRKPDGQIFEYAMKSFGLRPGRVYMVGDDIEGDIKGALNAGIEPIRFYPRAKNTHLLLFETKVRVIRHMEELLEVFPPISLDDSDDRARL